MTTFLLIVIAILVLALAVMWFLKRRAYGLRDRSVEELATMRAGAKATIESRIEALDKEAARIRAHYEAEARKSFEGLTDRLSSAEREIEQLRPFAAMKDAASEAGARLSEAIAEAAELKRQAKELLDQARDSAAVERAQ